ncbi:hypothetical protein PPL_05585 [Heterostelium album PN500]|uniref:RCC1-like domain-containing protein n=1 Tax=Heterostelium pallidum (strain ATCC 26659 / Pp 5 / PN500) TaxID=670386 RepID=D3BAK7_HETP5|nr:hypothetical protein PPL_05585 [Heterostelium album PN500]EFA81594.1 hypothetical protein PPL_05585 [Heterostelium album PN500]|eukprot:XP_020433711.1 hypothetical protein PPL_05585 [Heterostelium album PN500]
MISGVTQWLTCGGKSVDKWFFGEGEDESDSSDSNESLGSSERSDDFDETSEDDSDGSDTLRKSKKKRSQEDQKQYDKYNNPQYFGQLYSWGYNFYGQCALDNNHNHNNNNNNKQTVDEDDDDSNFNIIKLPTLIKQGLIVSMIACGDSHALAVLPNDATVLSWGCNRWGQLGLGDQVNRCHPTPISGLSQSIPVFVAAGSQHSFVLSKFGELFSFGCGTFGRLGHGNELPSFNPRPISTLVGKHIVSVAAGLMHSAAVDSQGALYTWGWNRYGQLGLGTVKKHTLPNKNKELERFNIVKVVCGKNHTLVLDVNGHVYSFGFNVCGQLGIGSYTDSIKPNRIDLDLKQNDEIIDIAAGYYHVLLLTKKGCVYSFGYISDGALGLGDVVGHQSRPKLMPFSHFNHEFNDSIDSYKEIYGEYNSDSENDINNNNAKLPPKVVELHNEIGDVAVKIAAGGWHSAIITSSGRLYTFGLGDNFRLGNNCQEDQDMPCIVNKEIWGVTKETTDLNILQNDLDSMSLLEKRKNRSKSPNSMTGVTTNRNNLNSNGLPPRENIEEPTESENSTTNQPTTTTTLNNSNNHNLSPPTSPESNHSIKTVNVHTKVVNVVIGSAFTLAVVNSTVTKT